MFQTGARHVINVNFYVAIDVTIDVTIWSVIWCGIDLTFDDLNVTTEGQWVLYLVGSVFVIIFNLKLRSLCDFTLVFALSVFF